VNQWLFEQCQEAINNGKRVAVIGGDHSSPLGYYQALAAKTQATAFCILMHTQICAMLMRGLNFPMRPYV
jgi:arginase family enzyme